MIAQLSPSVPRGRLASSSDGVRCGGYLSMYSGPVDLPQTSTSSKSSPTARMKMRTVRLLTLGLRMFSVYSATWPSRSVIRILGCAIARQRVARARDEQLDRIGEMLLRDVVVVALDAELVRLEQHVRVRVSERRLEAVRRELDQQAERILEVDRVHEAAILDAAVMDAALVEARDSLMKGRLRERKRDVVHSADVRRRASRIGT